MKRRIAFIGLIFLLVVRMGFSQGMNHQWLLGYANGLDSFTTSMQARLLFDSNNYNLISEQRKMRFFETEGNISDNNGNLLFASNGIWISDATGDTMSNGGNLNPNSFTNDYKDYGLIVYNGNMILPMPGDSSNYVLIHQTGNYLTNLSSTELFYSVIDMTLAGGLGAVVSKNNIIIQDTLGWGIAACKHANGRDWWIVVLDDSMKYVHKVLLTPSGLQNYPSQSLTNSSPYSLFAGQPSFSRDGTKFAFASTYGIAPGNWYHDVRLFSFDRCSGTFSNEYIINLSDSTPGVSSVFSSNSKFLYAASTKKIYQIDTDTNNILGSLKTVAINDGFFSPVPPLQSNFWMTYLAPNGKIYLTSGSSVIDLHYINYPDSLGMSCEVHQHDLHLPCYNVGTVPNHPNYYLGPVNGSICDSLGLSVAENNFDFRFKAFPNPVTMGNFSISYLLPQNKSGTLEIFDTNGKRVYAQTLPAWSTLQHISIPQLAEGMYQCMVRSGNGIAGRKMVVVRE